MKIIIKEIKRGLCEVDIDGNKIEIKTAFLKKMYVGDLINYVKDRSKQKRKSSK